MNALVIADIHANLDALAAVLRIAAGKYEEVWCLGDVVGYGPDPREAIAAVRRLQPVAVAGNHDRGATGLMDLAWFGAAARDALERHGPLLTADETAWLDALPLVREHQSFTLCHGSLVDPIRDYILTPLDAGRTLERAQTSVILTGHTHVPALWRRTSGGQVELESVPYGEPVSLREGLVVANPGSLGQPRDGNPAACHALVDTVRRTITFERVPYSVRRVMKKMRKQGYPESSVNRYGEGR